jgi:hypothetical protein
MDGWPTSMVMIAAIVGEEAARKLSEEFGGFRILVPRRPTPGTIIARTIGTEAAAHLCQEYGGHRVYVAKLAAAKAKKRAIAEATGSVAEIARRFGVSERWARRVRQQLNRG